MSTVVTGLSQDGDVKGLESALKAAGVSLEPLQVIGPEDSTPSISGGLVGEDLFIGDTSTGVPGISGHHRRIQRFFRNESLDDRLGDLEIPESELDNYVDALERGRTVVAYFSKPDTADRVAEIFRNAKLLNVRTF